LARDSTGLARQILVVAKVHLYAYALAEGIYQTRATFMKWAEQIHEETWDLLLPDLPYEAATMAELEVVSMSHNPHICALTAIYSWSTILQHSAARLKSESGRLWPRSTSYSIGSRANTISKRTSTPSTRLIRIASIVL
jgi:hypothetical protein